MASLTGNPAGAYTAVVSDRPPGRCCFCCCTSGLWVTQCAHQDRWRRDSPERSCATWQICNDTSSQDGSAWSVDHGFFRCAMYDHDPAVYCSLFGDVANQEGLRGIEACCSCGGGSCVDAASENPITRQSLLNLYADTAGESWHISTDWGSNLTYCEWYGVTCKSGTSEVTEL